MHRVAAGMAVEEIGGSPARLARPIVWSNSCRGQSDYPMPSLLLFAPIRNTECRSGVVVSSYIPTAKIAIAGTPLQRLESAEVGAVAPGPLTKKVDGAAERAVPSYRSDAHEC